MKHIIFAALFLLLATFTTVSAQSSSIKMSYENGITLAHGRTYKAALKEFENALVLTKGKSVSNDIHARIHFNIGVCLYQLHRETEAARAFEQAVRYKPRYERAYYALGMAAAETGNWNDAGSAFRRAISIDRKNGETWFDLAYVYLAQRNFAAARLAFERSTKYGSVDSATSHNNIGVIMAMKGEFTRAEAEFKRAIFESGGSLDEARRNLDFCRRHTGNGERDIADNLEFGKAKRTIGE